MTALKDYYNNWKKKMQALSIPIWILLSLLFLHLNDSVSLYITELSKNEIPLITQENLLLFKLLLDLLFDFIAPTSISLLIYRLVLKHVDQNRWKKKYPQYDISGKWRDTTYYTQYMDNNGLSRISQQHSELSPVIIEQTCHEIRIKDSIGEGFKWYSLLCDWNDSNLDILYSVEYYSPLQQKGYPEKRYGYECMSIDTKNQSPKEKPRRMVGKFWHCCSADGKPIYMGEVVYERDANE